ncbi:MAG: hypothetical protein GY787_15560 [Alteromonadales bacterium]|nr:hypothetical protein [Alteromonadales bacterium]MCP4987483.1 hypothetical protein [Colwellia sp.]
MKAIVIFILLVIPVHFYMQDIQTVTADFSKVASHFYIVGEKEGDFYIIPLSKALESGNEYNFHLGNDQIDFFGGKYGRIFRKFK